MKIKLMKCYICSDWYSPHRSHCPNCGAAPIAVGNTTIHVDAACEYKPGILMDKSTTFFSVLWTDERDTLLQVARELSR